MADVEPISREFSSEPAQPTVLSKEVGHAPAAQSTRAPARAKRRRTPIPPLDNTMRVTTPENISFEYRVAGPFQRSMAYLLDVLLTVSGFAALAAIMFLLMTFAILPLANRIGLGSFAETIAGVLVGLMLILYFLVYWFYGAYMETMFNGQTLGKRFTGLRVLSVNGHAIDGVQATLRNFFRLLDVWPVISIGLLFDFRDADPEFENVARNVSIPTFLIGLVVMSFNRKFQRIGDLVADTVVVREAKISSPNLVSFADPRVPMLAELIPNFVPSNNFAKAIASYADLRHKVNAQRADYIASHVAKPLLEKFGMASDTNYDLFLCALYYKFFASSRSIDDQVYGPSSISQIAHQARQDTRAADTSDAKLIELAPEMASLSEIRLNLEPTDESR